MASADDIAHWIASVPTALKFSSFTLIAELRKYLFYTKLISAVVRQQSEFICTTDQRLCKSSPALLLQFTKFIDQRSGTKYTSNIPGLRNSPAGNIWWISFINFWRSVTPTTRTLSWVGKSLSRWIWRPCHHCRTATGRAGRYQPKPGIAGHRREADRID